MDLTPCARDDPPGTSTSRGRRGTPPARRRAGAARLAAALGLLALLVTLPAAPAAAHPLGNFTTNTSAAIRVRPDEVLVDYVIDLAEIPTVQARPEIDADGDDELSDDERTDYARATCETAAARLEVTVDGRTEPLELVDTEISFPKGQAGLSTSRLECALRRPARVDGDRSMVRFTDTNFSDKLGWREIIAVGDRTTIVDADVDTESISRRLNVYPKDRISSPPRELEARVSVVPGGPAASVDTETSDLPIVSADRLTSLVSEQRLTVPFALFAVVVSFVLGAFHALAPGHGKTVMAAYLVGEQGTRRQALLLGATVALTHTGGVFALALVVSNSSLAPERLYPLLGTLSGLLVVGIGVVLLRRAVQFRRLFPTLGPGARHHHHGIGGHTHSHDEDDAHAGGGHDHEHAGRDHDHAHVEGHGHDHGDHRHIHDDGHTHTVGPTGDDGGPGHGHGHDDGLAHAGARTLADVAPDHDGHAHDHAHGDDEGDGAGRKDPAVGSLGPATKARNMMAMGFAGGLVPSPSALVVLLGSIAIGRAWFGFVLIVAYGAGLAAVLVGAGLVLERLRHRIEPLLARRSHPRLTKLASNLPLVTSVLVVAGGLYLVARALSET